MGWLIKKLKQPVIIKVQNGLAWLTVASKELILTHLSKRPAFGIINVSQFWNHHNTELWMRLFSFSLLVLCRKWSNVYLCCAKSEAKSASEIGDSNKLEDTPKWFFQTCTLPWMANSFQIFWVHTSLSSSWTMHTSLAAAPVIARAFADAAGLQSQFLAKELQMQSQEDSVYAQGLASAQNHAGPFNSVSPENPQVLPGQAITKYSSPRSKVFWFWFFGMKPLWIRVDRRAANKGKEEDCRGMSSKHWKITPTSVQRAHD